MNPLQFGDKYILLDKIGSGGVAEVFRGKLTREQGFEKLLVIKKLLPEHNDDREMVDIFISEARLAALMQHDNIAAIYDFGEIDGEYFLAMEYLSGKNLHAVMARVRDHQESFTPAHALAVCSRICEGMEYAHSLRDLQNKPLNLVHRDLTPHNIFITYDGKVKILDFGVAKAELFDNKTREGVVKGKISYMSPERLTGEAVDSRADIFSIGILLYEMIGKARMYQGDTAELIRKCLTADFVNLRELAPNLDRRFYAILDKALAVDVDRRYRSCAEMQADIEDLLFDLQQRVDSKFLKTSIRQLFAREYEEEQRKIAVLWTGYDGAKPPASDGTDRFIRPRDENRDESDKTVLLRYQPALQLVKSKTREWHGRVRRMAAEIPSMLGKPAIDKRYLWGGAGIVAVVLLAAVFWSGDRTPPDSSPRHTPPVAAPSVDIADAPEIAEAPPAEEVQITAAPTAIQEDAPVSPPSAADGGEAEMTVPPAAAAKAPASHAPPVAGAAATVPVLKTREVKIKKQQTAAPVPVAPVAGDRPEVRSIEPFAQKETVDVSGLTLSFEEDAESSQRRKDILALHTNADEALKQGRLLEPEDNNAYLYYRQILELDPDDSRARDGLRMIGDKYAAVAETALNEQALDRAAEYVAHGLTVMPGYPSLVALDQRVRRERAERIDDLSEKARLCLDADKLSSPADDSAYFYYREILRLDPENSQARKGYTAIADRYAQLAEQAFLDLQFADAERFVSRGLQVVPNHYYLLSLQQELQRSDLEKVGHSMKKRINKLFSK